MAQKVIITTADLKESYTILQVITAHRRLTKPKILDRITIAKVNEMLRNEANELEADAVVGVGYTIERTTTGASVLGFGTAVRFIK